MVLPSTTASSGSTPAQAEDRLLQSTQARIANRNFMAPLPTAAPADGRTGFPDRGLQVPPSRRNSKLGAEAWADRVHSLYQRHRWITSEKSTSGARTVRVRSARPETRSNLVLRSKTRRCATGGDRPRTGAVGKITS